MTSMMSTRELMGKRVVGGKKGNKRIGKVRACVFHPKKRRIVGFMVKRPDVAMMFRRKDLFVALDGFDIVDGRIQVSDHKDLTKDEAAKAQDVALKECVLWLGLPVLTQSGERLGSVGSVVFDRETGLVESLEVSAGATANALLGRRQIPAEFILGFRRGVGEKLTEVDDEADEYMLGAIVVDDQAAAIESEGGLAEKAGVATAVVVDKAKRATKSAVNRAKPKVKDVVEKSRGAVTETVEKARPRVKEAQNTATEVAGEAINMAAFATGRQLERAKGMFSGFKDEFDKAMKDE